MNNKRKVPRILLGAAASGSGKTLLTCGLLQGIKKQKPAGCFFQVWTGLY